MSKDVLRSIKRVLYPQPFSAEQTSTVKLLHPKMQLKFLALWATAAAAASITKTTQACRELQSKFPESVYLPNEANYTAQRLGKHVLPIA